MHAEQAKGGIWMTTHLISSANLPVEELMVKLHTQKKNTKSTQ